MPSSKLSTKGQIVIPKEIREFLEIRPGDRIDFVVRDDGQVWVRPAVVEVRELRGLLRRPDREPVTVEEMKRAVRDRRRSRT